MKKFDLIVIGSDAGMNVASASETPPTLRHRENADTSTFMEDPCERIPLYIWGLFQRSHNNETMAAACGACAACAA